MRVEVKKEEEVGKTKEVLVMVLRTTFVFAKGNLKWQARQCNANQWMGSILNDGWFKRNGLHRREGAGRWAWILIWWVITGQCVGFRWGRYTLEGSVTFSAWLESKQRINSSFPKQHSLLRRIRNQSLVRPQTSLFW